MGGQAVEQALSKAVDQAKLWSPQSLTHISQMLDDKLGLGCATTVLGVLHFKGSR